MNRIEFPPSVRKLLAERAAFRCSFPICNAITIGPSLTGEQSTSTGVAAHIYSASSGGPRGQGGLTPDELRSVSNGIWLCSEHATLVDNRRGRDFPAEKLHGFKALHEARVAREHSGISAPEFWFHEMQISKSPGFCIREILRFGKVTVVVGNNGSGKSAICDWLAGLTGAASLRRWTGDTEVDVSAKYYSPEEKSARIRIAGNGRVSYFSDSVKVPFYANPIQLIRLPQDHYRLDGEMGDVERISQILSIDVQTIWNLIELIAEQNEGRIEGLRIEIDDETGESVVKALNRKRNVHVSLCAMSDSERVKLLIEICVARARLTSRFLPTLVLLDGVHSLDHDGFRDTMKFLLASDNHFQTLVTRIVPPKARAGDWAGWEFVTLTGKWGEVRIDQSPF